MILCVCEYVRKKRMKTVQKEVNQNFTPFKKILIIMKSQSQ